MSMTARFFLVFLMSAALGIGVFVLLWGFRVSVYNLLYDWGYYDAVREDQVQKIEEGAVNISLEPSGWEEENAGEFEKLQELLDLRNDYTTIVIYELDENGNPGTYITGAFAEMSESIWAYDFIPVNWGVHADMERGIEKIIQFKDQKAWVGFYSYDLYRMLPAYLIISIAAGILVFIIPQFLYLRRKMRELLRLKDEVLYMAQGDLEREINAKGGDEIGILARQMNHLRLTLEENNRKEQESRNANRDLISALSHDLRTPLTVLSGYLEVLRLGRGEPESRSRYLENCIHKVEEIRELSDKMFEYALVFEQDEEFVLESVPVESFQNQLRENINFLRLVGFCVRSEIRESAASFQGNESALKRVQNNLFSNILKYGDKRQEVCVECAMEDGRLRLALRNHISLERTQAESSGIGLKSAERIVKLHGGEIHCEQGEGIFAVELVL